MEWRILQSNGSFCRELLSIHACFRVQDEVVQPNKFEQHKKRSSTLER